MTDKQFWELISEARKKSKGEFDKQIEIIVSKLVNLPVEEIIDYDRIFSMYHVQSYNSKLWASAYIINGGCSDDGFDYFRAWLISMGQKVYHDALENPESLAKVVKEDEAGDVEFEDFLYVAQDAYKQKTHKEDFYDKVVRQPYPQIFLTWSEDEDELQRMFPKLAKKFL